MAYRIAIVPGHGNRWRKRVGYVYDPGAVKDGVEEAVWVRRLADAVVEAAPVGLVKVFDEPNPGGPLSTYTNRVREAHRWLGNEPGIVLHVHCNAGGPRKPYSMAMHDPRSRGGAHAAGALSCALGEMAPALSSWAPCKVIPARRPDWAHAANLVEKTWRAPAAVCAVLLEWGFVDVPGAGAHYDACLDETAHAIASLTR
jgi:hypothetical protein